MIEQDFAAKQIERMAALRDYPKSGNDGDKAARRELLKALCAAETEQHAVNVIDEFVHWGNNFCPTPAQIRKALFALRTPPEEPTQIIPKDGYSCGFVCDGWGVVGERPNITWCTCDHAEWLKTTIPNYLELANMEASGMRIAIPRLSRLADALASGAVPGPRRKSRDL